MRLRRNDRGQSTVEFALVLPLVVMVVLLLVQVALLTATKLATLELARDVAREVALDPSSAEVDRTSAADRDSSNAVSITIEPHVAETSQRSWVFVSVIDENPPTFAIFALFLGDFVVRSEVKMLTEP